MDATRCQPDVTRNGSSGCSAFPRITASGVLSILDSLPARWFNGAAGPSLIARALERLRPRGIQVSRFAKNLELIQRNRANFWAIAIKPAPALASTGGCA